MKKYYALALAHFLSSLGSAVFLNVAIGISAGESHFWLLAGIQLVILSPAILASGQVGRWIERHSLGRIMIMSDLVGAAAMLALVAALRITHGTGSWLLAGAAVCTLIDFLQIAAKGSFFILQESEREQVRLQGLMQVAQAVNLLFAPLLVSFALGKIPLAYFVLANAFSYLASFACVVPAARRFFRNAPSARQSSTPRARLSARFLCRLAFLGIMAGAAVFLAPVIGERFWGGSEGALRAEFFFSLGLILSGLAYEKFWLRYWRRTLEITGLLFAFALLLLVQASPWQTMLAAMLLGALVPLIECFASLVVREEFRPGEVPRAVARTAVVSRLAMMAGILGVAAGWAAWG